ncbi:MAG: hypothetical protein PVG98_09645, partial [Chromatiales bacterium]
MAIRTSAALALLPTCASLASYPVLGESRAVQEWQRERIFSPSASVIRQESGGQVFIFEGMLESDIDKAMETEFDRIDNMMFIRTIPTDDNG